jgi:predicted  nucleic acid-binding Zn-ribbon protein
LEADKALVTAKFDEAKETLEALRAEATELKESQEKQRKEVEEALESVEKAVSDLRESGKQRESDIRGFKADIDSIRELIPKVPHLKCRTDYRRWNAIRKRRRVSSKIFRMK